MNIVIWRDKAALRHGHPDYPVLSVVVDQEPTPIKVLRYLVFKNKGSLPYSFSNRDKADAFFDSVMTV